MVLDQIAQEGKLSLGMVFPLESYKGSVPNMKNQEKLAKKAEDVGFKALWFRDVPFNDPSFGDAGQIFDPWVYMAHIMNHTQKIILGTASIILPLRHPAHITKAMNSLQVLSRGRFVAGIASGDRPSEYPAFKQEIEKKPELFRDSFSFIKSLQLNFPRYKSDYFGETNGQIDLLPKTSITTPMLVTGHSGQSLDWIAENADGWMYYPRNLQFLQSNMNNWKSSLSKAGLAWKPYIQSLYVDLLKDNKQSPSPIHLGLRTDPEYLLTHLKALEFHGVNHVIINLKYGSRPIEEVLEDFNSFILPHFLDKSI